MNHLRFKDVLLALASAADHSVSLQRIQLQKFIYLHDILSAVWREIGKPNRFDPYKRGPYDRRIQNSVDALAFRGFVDVTSLDVQGLSLTKASYTLTQAGGELISILVEDAVLREEYQLGREIAIEIQRRGWRNLVDIVYSEPTYHKAKAANDGRTLQAGSTNRNQTARLARMFASSWGRTLERLPSKRVFVQTMFIVFDEIREASE